MKDSVHSVGRIKLSNFAISLENFLRGVFLSAEIMIVNFLIKQNHNRASSGPTWLIVIKPSKYDMGYEKNIKASNNSIFGRLSGA